MSSRFRFHSGTNRYAFEDWLATQGLAFSTMGDVVSVRAQSGEAYDEALSLGADVISSDFDHDAPGEAWADTAAQSTRGNPPKAMRGAVPFDPSAQIVSQPGYKPEKPPGSFPARRKTMGQP